MEKMKKKEIINTLWCEKFRPQTVKDTLLPKSIKSFFTKILNKKDIPNLLLYSSSPGTGKSTTAKALCKESGFDYIYINASNSGIDVLRTDIQKFAHAKSLVGGFKVVILDEFDGATPNLQNALRADIEKYHKTCRFIFTANYITKIIEPLKSRCQVIDFNMTDAKTTKEMADKIYKRLCGILKLQKINYSEDTVKKLVNTFYPDIRKMINILQQYANTYDYINDDIFNSERVDNEFYGYIINKQLTRARKYLIERNYNYDEIFRNLFDNFVPKLEKGKQSQVILIIGEYMYKNAFVIDKEINCTCMLLEIIGVL